MNEAKEKKSVPHAVASRSHPWGVIQIAPGATVERGWYKTRREADKAVKTSGIHPTHLAVAGYCARS